VTTIALGDGFFKKKKEKEKNRKEVDDFQRLYRLIRSL